MENRTDWKDIASSFYDKCLSLTILFIMFTFMVFPNVEVQNLRTNERVLETIEILPEIQERIEPPEEVARPIVNIEIVDDADDDSDDEILIITTIESSRIDDWESIAPPTRHGDTPRFVVYEDAPVILRRVAPEYPAVGRRAGIQGTVLLDIEVLVDGSIGAIEVVQSLMSGPGGFDEAALVAARQWQFQPAMNGGRPVACWVRLPVVFVLEN